MSQSGLGGLAMSVFLFGSLDREVGRASSPGDSLIPVGSCTLSAQPSHGLHSPVVVNKSMSCLGSLNSATLGKCRHNPGTAVLTPVFYRVLCMDFAFGTLTIVPQPIKYLCCFCRYILFTVHSIKYLHGKIFLKTVF